MATVVFGAVVGIIVALTNSKLMSTSVLASCIVIIPIKITCLFKKVKISIIIDVKTFTLMLLSCLYSVRLNLIQS